MTGQPPNGPEPFATAKERWLGLTPDRARHFSAAVATITVFGFAFGLLFPLLALRMEAAGLSTDIIGINTAMQPLGILFSGLAVPPLVARFGARRVVIVAALLAGLLVLIYPFTPIVWAWFVLRLVHGLVSGTLFAVSEAWVVEAADGPWRSRLIAIYSVVLAVSFGGGPSIIAVFGIEGVLPFAIGAAVLAAAIVPVLLLRDLPDHMHDGALGAPDAPPPAKTLSSLALFRKAPILLTAMAVFGVYDVAALSFLPLYGLAHGVSQAEAALMLSVLVFGNVFLQLPIGWLADKINKRLVLALLVLITAVLTALLPVAIGTWTVWPLLAVAGAASSGLSTLALAEMGERFRGTELVAGTSALATMWGIGALMGSLGTGAVMRAGGPDAYPWAMTGVMLLFLAAIAIRERQKRRLT
jgi:MFS family permease